MAGKRTRKRQKENSKKKGSKANAGENSSAAQKKPKLEEDAEHSVKNEALENHVVGRYVPPFTRNPEKTSTTKEDVSPIKGKTRRSWSRTKKLEANGYEQQDDVVQEKEEKSLTDVVTENDKPFGCHKNKEDTCIKAMWPVEIVSPEGLCNLPSGKASMNDDASTVVKDILTEIVDVISSQTKQFQNKRPVSDFLHQESHGTEAELITKNENCKNEMPTYSATGKNAISKEIFNKCQKEHILTDEAFQQKTCEKIENSCRVDIEFATTALEHAQSEHKGEGFVAGAILETTQLQRRIHDCGKDDVLTNETFKTTQSQATGEDSMDKTLRKANLKLDKKTTECEKGESTVTKETLENTLAEVRVEDSFTVATMETPNSEKQIFAHGNVLANTSSGGKGKDSNFTGGKADIFPDNFTLETTQLEEKFEEDSTINATSETTRLDKTITSLGKGGIFPYNLESETIQLKQRGEECMSGERNETTRLKNTFFHGCQDGGCIGTNIVSKNTPPEVVEEDTFLVGHSQPGEPRQGSDIGTTLKASLNNTTIIDSENRGLNTPDNVALTMALSEEAADNSLMGTALGISQSEKDVDESQQSLVNAALETVTNFGNNLGLCGQCENMEKDAEIKEDFPNDDHHQVKNTLAKTDERLVASCGTSEAAFPKEDTNEKPTVDLESVLRKSSSSCLDHSEKHCTSDDIASEGSHVQVDARTTNTEVSHFCKSDVSCIFRRETSTLCKPENPQGHDEKIPSDDVSIPLLASMSDKQQDDCQSFGSVGDLVDDDYLLDYTDSQLTHLDYQNIKPNCVDKKSVHQSQSNATVEEVTTQEAFTEHVADTVTDSGMIKGLISELSSLNAFIMRVWRDLETLKKHRHARLKSSRGKRLKLTGN